MSWSEIRGRLEGLFLIALGVCSGWFALLGNYEYLMNPRFRWVTVAGAGLVLLIGLGALLSPRRNGGWSGLAALAAMAAVVAVGRPHAYDALSLTMPEPPAPVDTPLVLDGLTYTPVSVDDLYDASRSGEPDYGGQDLLIAGMLMRSDELDAEGQFALMRPVSFCCAADALLVGFRAVPEAPVDLADQWVSAYGRLERSPSPLPRPRLRLGAIRFAAVSEEYLVRVRKVVPYVRKRPAEDVLGKLASGTFTTFLRLAEAAGLAERIAEHEMVTILAPVDAAFDRLPAGRVDGWLTGEDPAGLRSFVDGHVLVGCLMESDLRGLSSAETVGGHNLALELVNGALRVEGSRFLFENIEARNGVIHAIHPALRSAEK